MRNGIPDDDAGSSGAQAQSEPRAGWYAWYVAVLLSLTATLAYVDRYVMGLLTEPVKHDLNLTDVQLSLLQGLAFVLFYGVMAAPLGFLVDRWSRRGMVGICIFLWSIATGVCGLSGSFGQLFAGRLSVGIGEAGLIPSAHSMLPDYFDPKRLNRAFSLFMAGITLGGPFAFLGGGALLGYLNGAGPIDLPIFGVLKPWQLVFLAAGAPGTLFALMMLTVREPRRRSNPALRPELADATGFRQFIITRKVFLIAYMGTGIGIAMLSYAVVLWSTSFFVRTFGWTAGTAGMVVGTMQLVSAPTGAILGGIVSDAWSRRGVIGAPMKVFLWTYGATAISAVAFPLYPNAIWAVGFLASFTFFSSGAATVMPTVLQLATPHPYRGRMGAFYVLSTTVLGGGSGPFFVAFVTEHILHDTQRLAQSIAVVCAITSPIALAMGFLCYRQFIRLTVQPDAAPTRS